MFAFLKFISLLIKFFLKEIDVILACSANTLEYVPELFQLSQKAILYPAKPLFDKTEKVILLHSFYTFLFIFSNLEIKEKSCDGIKKNISYC